jgi:hypothetical protein
MFIQPMAGTGVVAMLEEVANISHDAQNGMPDDKAVRLLYRSLKWATVGGSKVTGKRGLYRHSSLTLENPRIIYFPFYFY